MLCVCDKVRDATSCDTIYFYANFMPFFMSLLLPSTVYRAPYLSTAINVRMVYDMGKQSKRYLVATAINKTGGSSLVTYVSLRAVID